MLHPVSDCCENRIKDCSHACERLTPAFTFKKSYFLVIGLCLCSRWAIDGRIIINSCQGENKPSMTAKSRQDLRLQSSIHDLTEKQSVVRYTTFYHSSFLFLSPMCIGTLSALDSPRRSSFPVRGVVQGPPVGISSYNDGPAVSPLRGTLFRVDWNYMAWPSFSISYRTSRILLFFSLPLRDDGCGKFSTVNLKEF